MMAKKAKASVNKSQAVREYLQANRDAKPKQAAEAISKQVGVEVTAAFVSQIKTLDRKKLGRPTGRTKPGSPSRYASGQASIAAAIKAGRELLIATGSTEEAVAVLKALAL